MRNEPILRKRYSTHKRPGLIRRVKYPKVRDSSNSK